MTALLTVERGRLDEPITVAKSDTWAEPSKLYLKAGDRYTRRQILGPMLVKSGNDAARLLARTHSGSEAEFGRSMTARARQLGMFNSNFVNASGLTAGGQYSTARDMGRLALKAYASSMIRQYSRLREIAFRYADGRSTTFTATNKLLSRSPYCNGLKTGYTRAAGKCLISSGSYKGRNVVIVMLGSNSNNIWGDSRSLLHWALGVQ
jgi:D-alanyl-D-alanine carboxypeptidase (penicillin-binding protein 5/6)